METMSAVDRQISGSFESNRGRLPMPVTGSYKIVSHFGQYDVEGLRNVKLDNKGINILCQPGASARSIFEGEVSAVVSVAGQLVVMVRHGDFISVYYHYSFRYPYLGRREAAAFAYYQSVFKVLDKGGNPLLVREVHRLRDLAQNLRTVQVNRSYHFFLSK